MSVYVGEEEQKLQERKTIPAIYQIKLDLIDSYNQMEKLDKRMDDLVGQINAYGFWEFGFGRSKASGEDRLIKQIDQECWSYLVKLFNLEKYMLCTEYEKLRKQIENYDFPVFDPDNANAWLNGLKKLVYDNIQKLIEDVFTRITDGTYRTGGSWYSEIKKKRNNNGIDKFFILRTYDYNELAYYRRNPTVTDDLEKACYIMDGKAVPEITIKESMRREKRWESSNDYFRIMVCKNGNTHYWINEEIRKKLNLYGARKGVFGEDIKIKVFEKEAGW